ncbi:hypothetical protein SUGI_0651720 [Cryptomeria japonica]|uniref:uncharacterized protein LOC131035684 n=1 Tax=Cryptomeria japonica TaxID=3369 RepID=UPI0024147E7A|nr:uncharacterized protein LOC131035684 [Cryptomeria japonica]GLJ32384.1 hypothetical protein SUGI_0651720 [Cryptomeria japonica]
MFSQLNLTHRSSFHSLPPPNLTCLRSTSLGCSSWPPLCRSFEPSTSLGCSSWPPLCRSFEPSTTQRRLFICLKKRGFTEPQIASIVTVRPQLIVSAESALESKIKLLEDFGFVDRNLLRLLRTNPGILNKSLKKGLLPKMEFLKNVYQSQDVLVKSLLNAPRLLNFSLEKTLEPSLAFWEGLGFSGMEFVSFLGVYPGVLSRTSLTPGQVDLINKIGMDKESKMFKYIVGIVALSRVETLEAKIENLKLCGLSAEETWQIVGAAPLVLNLSRKNVSERMNFLVNNLELPANYVVKHPSLFQIKLEKTLKPRFLVWQKIKSFNALDLPLLTALTMSETRFVNRIIKEHPELKSLWTIYENAISNASKHTELNKT